MPKHIKLFSQYINESHTEAADISQEIQALIDKNEFLKGKVKAAGSDLIEADNFVLLFSEETAGHIAERHLDGAKPGSLFRTGVDLRQVAKKLLNTPPTEEASGRVKWLAANGGKVGEMGVAKAQPEEVAMMQDYTMPDGRKETVKIAPGKRKPTSRVNLITADLGTLTNGKKALSLITLFPGGASIDGIEIPMNRGEFAAAGFYFIVDPTSPLLTDSITETVSRRYRRVLKENLDISEDTFDEILSDAWSQAADSFIPEEEPREYLNNVAFVADIKVKEINPTYNVDYQLYHGGKIEFSIYDPVAEENVMVNRSYSF
jgi:hypothetical protein